MKSHLALKALAPIAFFGYAGYANLALFTAQVDGPDLTGLLNGGVTAEIDTLYRANLPHRDPSVGLIGALRYALLNEGRDGVVVGQAGWLYTTEEFRPLDAPTLSETVAWIAQARTELAAMGTDLILVPLPGKLDIVDENTPGEDQSARIAQDYAGFRAALAAAKIETLDTRPILEAGTGRFFQTDTHWTPDAAADVARALAETGVVAPGEVAFTRIEQPSFAFTGDLVTFVTSDTLAPFVGLAPETVTPYIAEAPEAEMAALDIFGTDDPTPLALVGTSYSANPNWSFAEALKLALQQDVLNYAEEGFGPIAPMRAFLAQVDPEAPPPAVIWEFPVRYLTDPNLMGEDMSEEDGNA